MHLVELLSLRSVVAAGISFGLTRRCPLSCAHCSTNSTLTSEQAPAELFTRFAASFAVNDRPEILAMSGGEALLRPDLVRELAEMARKVGCRSTVLSGMFFARLKPIPLRILRAVRSVDHFSASIDAFHEREVPRADVFRFLKILLSEGRSVSLHVVGKSTDDPYLEKIVEEVQNTFGGRVPMLVNTVSHFGRARSWLARKKQTSDAEIETDPCAMAAWPVVGFDGRIVTCGNDDVLDRDIKHLQLGHANIDSWPVIRSRCLKSSMARAVRLFGPRYIAGNFGAGKSVCQGYCQTCMKLTPDAGLEERVGEMMARPSVAVLEEEVSALQRRAGAVAFARRHGNPHYAELVTLGASA